MFLFDEEQARLDELDAQESRLHSSAGLDRFASLSPENASDTPPDSPRPPPGARLTPNSPACL